MITRFAAARRCRTFLPRLVAISLALTTFAANAEAADRVILLSWDGIRRDVLQELLHWQDLGETPVACPAAKRPATMPVACNGHLTCLPNICQMQIIDSNVVEGKPLTKPQHAQMLSGYGVVEVGEITNSGKKGLPQGYSIYERIAAVRPEVVTVHIGGNKFIGRAVIRFAKKFGQLQYAFKRGGRDGYTGTGTTERITRFALPVIGNDPFFLFMHYKAADVLAHRSSDNSKQYREAIIANDQQLGAIQQILADHGLNDTVIFITTDHGFDGIFHVNPATQSVVETWVATSDHSFQFNIASVLDVTPTILDTFGIDFTQFSPPYRGDSLR